MSAIFQFHKGAIRTCVRAQPGTRILYFNSIKVRLELSPIVGAGLSLLFQFHKGAIRTVYQLLK